MADDDKISKDRSLVPVDPPHDTSVVLDTVYRSLLEGATGVASSRKQELFRSAGEILQRARSVGFVNSLKDEWNEYREKGRIKDDYVETEQHRECLQELLDSLEDPGLTVRRFAILKKILFVAATEQHTDRESLLPQQYMQLARSLTPGEVVVLFATFTRAREREWKDDQSGSSAAATWVRDIAELSGLKLGELVRLNEQALMDKMLLTRRVHPDGSGVRLAPNYRLTELGYDLCAFVEQYEEGVEAD